MAKINLAKLKSRLSRAAKIKKPVMTQAWEYFRKITPRRTGNARRSTRLINNRIVADYHYAEVLDRGRHMTTRGIRGSKQAPDGMSKPTIKKFGQWVAAFIDKIG